jgi:hypothetical protein
MKMNARSIVPVLLVLALVLSGVALAQRAGTAGERWDRDDVVTLEGRITDVARPFATLQADGGTYRLHLGPQWYWDREGYEITTGDSVEVTGQIAREGDITHLYLHSMRRDGTTYRFATSDGVPLWSHGRGAGYGAGRGGPGWHHHRGRCAGNACDQQGAGPCCSDCPGSGCPCGGCPCAGASGR